MPRSPYRPQVWPRNKRQTTFRFERVRLNLPGYITSVTDAAGIDDREVARSTKESPDEYKGLKIQAIKWIRARTYLGLKEAKDYVEACMAAYPEECS